MSRIFGAFVQQGYVVPDILQAMQHWIARGVGPFYIEHLQNFDGTVDGTDCKLELKAAFSYSGDQQIEVIQPLGTTSSIYEEFLQQHPDGGLQHLAVWVDNIDDKLSELQGLGHRFTVRQRYGDAHAYIDSNDHPGVMIQLMERNPSTTALFEIIKDGVENWDGVADPVRRIDWSTGEPHVQAAAE